MSSLLRTLPSSTSRSAATSIVGSRRSVHKLRPYPNLDLNKGIPGFLGPTSLKVLAVDYQQGLLDRLNDVTLGTEYDHLTVLQTIKKASDDPAASLIFSYASQALNNSLFLDGLTTDSKTWNGPIEAYLESSFVKKNPTDRGLAAFEAEFYSTVENMTGPGWVWLVQQVNGDHNRIAIKVSYGAGSAIFPWRMQPGPRYELTPRRLPAPRPITPGVDADHLPPTPQIEGWEHTTTDPDSLVDPRTAKRGVPSSEFESSSSSSKRSEEEVPKESYKVYPLACLSMHERSYVPKFGFSQKSIYANKWLTNLDWNKVWARTSRRDMVDLSGFEKELRNSPHEKERKMERLGGESNERVTSFI